MWYRIGSSVDQTLTALVHAQAEADAADIDLDVLGSQPIVSLPAARLYLIDPWQSFLAELRNQPIIQTIGGIPRIHDRVVEAGSRAVFEIWRRLGLHPIEHPGRDFGFKVDAPLR